MTRREFLSRIEVDASLVIAAIGMIHRRHLARERLPSPAGWMSSDVPRGEALYMRLAATTVTKEDFALAKRLARRYSRQVTRDIRESSKERGRHETATGAVRADEAPRTNVTPAGRNPSAEDDATPSVHAIRTRDAVLQALAAKPHRSRSARHARRQE